MRKGNDTKILKLLKLMFWPVKVTKHKQLLV